MDYNIFRGFFANDKLLFSVPMSEYTSFKIGGPADLMIMPTDSWEIKKAIELSNENGLSYHVMGKGSNLLVKDHGFRGVIICTSKNLESFEFLDEHTIKAGAGITLAKLAAFAGEASLTGLEFASGIPGSLGGAVYMNAGAYGGEMKDIVLSAGLIDKNGNEVTIDKSEMALEYRSSIFQKANYIITDCTLRLTKGNKDEIKEKMLDLNGRRKEKQPLDLPSGGSTFKRPEGHFASKLIEEAQLKGYSIGGAKVSEKHAGFIVNYNSATASDVISLIEYVKAKVYDKFAVSLIPEIEIIGE